MSTFALNEESDPTLNFELNETFPDVYNSPPMSTFALNEESEPTLNLELNETSEPTLNPSLRDKSSFMLSPPSLRPIIALTGIELMGYCA